MNGFKANSMATIRDVAEASGVSITTVSFALNNNLRRVNPETRLRIMEVARKLNYHPNAMARGLVQKRIHTIGVLITNIESSIVSNPYANAVLSGICAETSLHQYDIQLHTRKWETAAISAPFFLDRRTDGILIIAPPIDSDIVSGLDALDIPIVVVSSPTNVTGIASVDTDNIAGARLATQHLLSLGHTRIAHLMGDPIQHSVFERRDAFLTTMRGAGITVPEEYITGESFQLESIQDSARRLFHLPSPPTAIFTTNDHLAYCVLHAAQDAGISVPGQLSVIGFDDYPESSRTMPALTTIHHPLWEVGQQATRILLSIIADRSSDISDHRLSPELIVRSSTAPPMNKSNDVALLPIDIRREMLQ